jgi:hypothetical protein
MKSDVQSTRDRRGNSQMPMDAEKSTGNTASELEREHELSQIRDALRGLRFGAINIVVQDGVVVQIDRTEKRRVRQATAR